MNLVFKKEFKVAFKFLTVFYLIFMIPTMIWRWSWVIPLAINSQHTSGVQSEIYTQDHCTCKYSFKVDDTVYEGLGNSCCNIEPGKPIDVYYNSNNPKRSYNFEPKRLLVTDLLGAVFGFLIWASLASSFYSAKNAWLKKQSGEDVG